MACGYSRGFIDGDCLVCFPKWVIEICHSGKWKIMGKNNYHHNDPNFYSYNSKEEAEQMFLTIYPDGFKHRIRLATENDFRPLSTKHIEG